jgi:outer membrane protein assembly factor BamD
MASRGLQLWVATGALVAWAVTGCAGTDAEGVRVSYLDTARSNYDKGMAELKDENFVEATKYFTYVKNKFPFSGYAKLAELRIADTYFAQEKWLEAIDAYKLFLRFHPTHPEVQNGYASYRICQGYVEQIPSDWFLIPPSHEKDQSATYDALRELASFARTFPQSKYLAKVRELHRKCIRKLADHEIYVAQFYLERDKPKAAILRLEALLQQYPDAGVDPEVMFLLGQTYLKMEQRSKAREVFASLMKRYPSDPHSSKARLYLQYMTEQRE